MADPYRKLRRQIDRKKHKEYYQQLKEDQLLDIAYHGLIREQIQQDEQLKNLTEWLSKPYK